MNSSEESSFDKDTEEEFEFSLRKINCVQFVKKKEKNNNHEKNNTKNNINSSSVIKKIKLKIIHLKDNADIERQEEKEH